MCLQNFEYIKLIFCTHIVMDGVRKQNSYFTFSTTPEDHLVSFPLFPILMGFHCKEVLYQTRGEGHKKSDQKEGNKKPESNSENLVTTDCLERHYYLCKIQT